MRDDIIFTAGLAVTAFALIYLLGMQLASAQEPMTLTLSWDAATERIDGSPIDDDADGKLLYYLARAISQPPDAADAKTIEHEVTPDRTSVEFQVLSGECYEFRVFTVAAPGPACQPTQHYTMSSPSEPAYNCVDEIIPKPPGKFGELVGL